MYDTEILQSPHLQTVLSMIIVLVTVVSECEYTLNFHFELHLWFRLILWDFDQVYLGIWRYILMAVNYKYEQFNDSFDQQKLGNWETPSKIKQATRESKIKVQKSKNLTVPSAKSYQRRRNITGSNYAASNNGPIRRSHVPIIRDDDSSQEDDTAYDTLDDDDSPGETILNSPVSPAGGTVNPGFNGGESVSALQNKAKKPAGAVGRKNYFSSKANKQSSKLVTKQPVKKSSSNLQPIDNLADSELASITPPTPLDSLNRPSNVAFSKSKSQSQRPQLQGKQSRGPGPGPGSSLKSQDNSQNQKAQDQLTIPTDPFLKRIKKYHLPIVWIIGEPTTHTKPIVRNYCDQLADSLNFKYINLDDKIGEWYEREVLSVPSKFWKKFHDKKNPKGKKENNVNPKELTEKEKQEASYQLATQPPARGCQIKVKAKLTESLLAQANVYDKKLKLLLRQGGTPILPKFENAQLFNSQKKLCEITIDTRDPLKREKVMEVLKYAMVESLHSTMNTGGFIIDGSFTDRTDFIKFKQMFYIPTVGLYFTESPVNAEMTKYRAGLKTLSDQSRVLKLTMDETERAIRSKVNIVKPKNFRRIKQYSFIDADFLCDEFKDKIVRIVNAEHLNRSTIKYINSLVRKHLRHEIQVNQEIKIQNRESSQGTRRPQLNTDTEDVDEVDEPKAENSTVETPKSSPLSATSPNPRQTRQPKPDVVTKVSDHESGNVSVITDNRAKFDSHNDSVNYAHIQNDNSDSDKYKLIQMQQKASQIEAFQKVSNRMIPLQQFSIDRGLNLNSPQRQSQHRSDSGHKQVVYHEKMEIPNYDVQLNPNSLDASITETIGSQSNKIDELSSSNFSSPSPLRTKNATERAAQDHGRGRGHGHGHGHGHRHGKNANASSHSHEDPQKKIELEFEKIRYRNLPIIWIYGFKQTSIASQRQNCCVFLAKYFNFAFLQMDEQIVRWHRYSVNKSSWDKEQLAQGKSPSPINNVQELVFYEAKRIIKKVIPGPFVAKPTSDANTHAISNSHSSRKESHHGELLTRAECLTLIKYAMIHSMPTNGFIIDNFPLNSIEAVDFEKFFYPVALGMYFSSSNDTSALTSPKAFGAGKKGDRGRVYKYEKPKFFLSDASNIYTETLIQKLCKDYAKKTIRILNVEELQPTGMEEICRLVVKHIQAFKLRAAHARANSKGAGGGSNQQHAQAEGSAHKKHSASKGQGQGQSHGQSRKLKDSWTQPEVVIMKHTSLPHNLNVNLHTTLQNAENLAGPKRPNEGYFSNPGQKNTNDSRSGSRSPIPSDRKTQHRGKNVTKDFINAKGKKTQGLSQKRANANRRYRPPSVVKLWEGKFGHDNLLSNSEMNIMAIAHLAKNISPRTVQDDGNETPMEFEIETHLKPKTYVSVPGKKSTFKNDELIVIMGDEGRNREVMSNIQFHTAGYEVNVNEMIRQHNELQQPPVLANNTNNAHIVAELNRIQVYANGGKFERGQPNVYRNATNPQGQGFGGGGPNSVLPQISEPSTTYETANSSEDDFDEGDDDDSEVTLSKTSTIQGLVFGADGRKSKNGLITPNSRLMAVTISHKNSEIPLSQYLDYTNTPGTSISYNQRKDGKALAKAPSATLEKEKNRTRFTKFFTGFFGAFRRRSKNRGQT